MDRPPENSHGRGCDDRGMPLTITTDGAEIAHLIDAVLLADPVGNTILGSIREYLRRYGDAGWCAHDDAALAVRSSPVHPIALTGGWPSFGPLAAAIAALPSVVGLGGPGPAIDALAARLGREPVHRTAERLFRLDTLVGPVGVAGTARPGTRADLDRLDDWYASFHDEAHPTMTPAAERRARLEETVADGTAHLWVDPAGRPVSMAMGRPPVAGVARIGPVYTPTEHRGHGYGSAATADAARAILTRGAVPVLFTDLANPTSNKIYQALGFRPVADRVAVTYG
jgi:GNAT superfamily N-acetyltransferase